MGSKPKIVFLKSRLNFRGGLEKYTHRLADAFFRKNWEVTILTTGHEYEMPTWEGIKIIPLTRDSKFTLYHLLHFNTLCEKWLSEYPQECVFGLERNLFQTHYRAGNGVHAAYLRQRELIDTHWKQWTFQWNPLHRLLIEREKRAFENPKLKALFTNSLMVEKEIRNNFFVPPEKIHVIHNLFIGNDYRRKGLCFLLEGLSLIRSKNFLLMVLGREKNISFFQTYAKRLGLVDKISFLGPQKDVIPFYQKADALAIPSIYDPFANVTLEALSMGLYVVSSLFNGGAEVLQSDIPRLSGRSFTKSHETSKNGSFRNFHSSKH
jgi:UDP-glucose:(heptosyl)LPS alpha-1,3-glucosyltransferase